MNATSASPGPTAPKNNQNTASGSRPGELLSSQDKRPNLLDPVSGLSERRTFSKSWTLKLNDPRSQRALWIRFAVLSSQNGFRRVAEVAVVYFEKVGKDTQKVALKQTHDLSAFLASDQSTIRIGNCELSPNRTRGSVSSKGRKLEWDLSFVGIQDQPVALRSNVITLGEDLIFSGSSVVDGKAIHWKDCPGMEGFIDHGRSNADCHWAHCSSFETEGGSHLPMVFEGYLSRRHGFFFPQSVSFYVVYQSSEYFFNNFKNLFAVQSRVEKNQWKFRADREDLSFRGEIWAEHKDFAGITDENTQGDVIYSCNTEMASMRLGVYRKGKLEVTALSKDTTSFEILSNKKNPYVTSLI